MGIKHIMPSSRHADTDQSSILPDLFLIAISCILFATAFIHDENTKPLSLALPHQPQKFVLVTALYDLGREDRPFDEYLPWFRRTLRKLSPEALHMVVFCKERRVADMAREQESSVIVVLEEAYPLSRMVEAVVPILENRTHHEQQQQLHRDPEWVNKDYILLQFSKFRWLQRAMELVPDVNERSTSFFWVDAGISRFLVLGQRSMGFPLLKEPHHISVQSQLTSVPYNATEVGECMGCLRNVFKAGIFGGDREDVQWLSGKMLEILEKDFIAKGVMDNEQAGMALLYSRYPERFNLLFRQDFVGPKSSSLFSFERCGFICI